MSTVHPTKKKKLWYGCDRCVCTQQNHRHMGKWMKGSIGQRLRAWTLESNRLHLRPIVQQILNSMTLGDSFTVFTVLLCKMGIPVQTLLDCWRFKWLSTWKGVYNIVLHFLSVITTTTYRKTEQNLESLSPKITLIFLKICMFEMFYNIHVLLAFYSDKERQ